MKINPKVTKECKGCILIADCKRDDNDICLGWNNDKQILALQKILRVSEKAAREYERIEKKQRRGVPSGEEVLAGLLYICCRALEKIEDLARKGIKGKRDIKRKK